MLKLKIKCTRFKNIYAWNRQANTVAPWAISTHVRQIIYFEILKFFISTNGIFSNIQYYPSQYFFDLEEIIFENFNISKNNIISV
jgi:hypothetical protein